MMNAKSKDTYAELTGHLVSAMKKVFGGDTKRISHALNVLKHARTIAGKERNVDTAIVIAAAVLHDIGIHAAERKYGSSAGVYQEKEGPAIAEPILREIGMDKKSSEHVLRIIANHHNAKDIDTLEFRVLWDADWLVNMPDEYPDMDRDVIRRRIDKIFRTETGKEEAHEMFLEREVF
jgi:hypothetical protein